MTASSGKRRLVLEASDLAGGMLDQVAILSKQVQQLQLCTQALQRQTQRGTSDRGTQAELGTASYPLAKAKQQDHTQPFSFKHPDQCINWKRLRHLEVDRLLEGNDTSSVMEVFMELAYGDLQGEPSPYNLTEANILKMFRLSQLALQFLHFKLDEQRHAAQVLDDESLALAAGLAGMPSARLGDVCEGLGALGRRVGELGATHVDAMFESVRDEERQAGKAALAGAIKLARHTIEHKHGLSPAKQPMTQQDTLQAASYDQLHMHHP